MDLYTFPPIENARDDGLLAIGGDVHPDRLLIAYKKGVFPWYNEGEPVLWYSPLKRMVLFPEKLKISKSMRSILRKNVFTITFNSNFPEVIRYCKTVPRNSQDTEGTWITDALEKSMLELHRRGIAKSVEVWKDGIVLDCRVEQGGVAFIKNIQCRAETEKQQRGREREHRVGPDSAGGLFFRAGNTNNHQVLGRVVLHLTSFLLL